MSVWAEETYDVYDEYTVKARKSHECCACDDGIAPGHRYTRVGIVHDGRAWALKRCLRCQTIHKHLRTVLTERDEWPDEYLACGHEYEEMHGEPPPPEIARLAFLTPAEVQAAMRGES